MHDSSHATPSSSCAVGMKLTIELARSKSYGFEFFCGCCWSALVLQCRAFKTRRLMNGALYIANAQPHIFRVTFEIQEYESQRRFSQVEK